MFQRREKRNWKENVAKAFKPERGWGRVFKYYWFRLKRISVRASTYSVACGMSLGWLISFNPMVGTHTFWLMGFCWLMRANFPAAMIMSLVGNIATFPFYFWVSYQVGSLMLSLFGIDGAVLNPDDMAVSEDQQSFGETFFITFAGWPIIGGIMFLITYFPHFYLVKYLREAYQKHRLNKQQKREV